ncbi:MAG: sugar ABC transporter ATP-binding protein [Rhizobiaceae bacterium]|nr:sugar ABC transporter ATP-binding protein [Rhizobiaceae bacterium]
MNAGASGNIAVEMRAISKRFGGVHALREVNFSARSGEIHALLGENGAGKSTILKILRGVLAPDSGEIVVDGTSLPSLTAKTAREHGIGMIFQEMSLVPSLTVAQNVFLNNEPLGRTGLIDERAMREHSLAILRDMGVEFDPDALVADLSTGQQQLTEIAKALSQDARILVLDEPTSALTASEVEILFDLLRRLRSEGKAIIYVSHRMDEIFQLADRATVLRDGHHIDTRPIGDYTLATLISDIMGKATRDLLEYSTDPTGSEDVVLEVRNLRGGQGAGASFALHRGEVLGIAGLLGSGRSRLARMLFGLERIASGEVLIRNEPVQITSPQMAMAAGMALVPEDRRRQGLVLQHSVAQNIELPVLDRLSASPFISGRTGRETVRDIISRMNIKTHSPDSDVNTLSGGNQQKVVIGKWLATQPDILIMDEATAGIDIGSKGEILRLVRELASEGKSIIFISSELAELLAVSDRICVMARGEIVQTLDARRLAADDHDPHSELQAEQKLQLLLQQGRRHD